ncbi:MAG TPA: hypothetical protein VHE33_10030 [Acidobacteriaceae bacterium]|nr:hypothetical protein [Acidobacteriaceae bacterium]
MTEMQPPEIKSLDFSEFHPLDHSVWACDGFPGGRKRHLQYRWDFQWRDRLRSWTLCKIGRHRPVESWGRSREDAEAGRPMRSLGWSCACCYKDTPPVS